MPQLPVCRKSQSQTCTRCGWTGPHWATVVLFAVEPSVLICVIALARNIRRDSKWWYGKLMEQQVNQSISHYCVYVPWKNVGMYRRYCLTSRKKSSVKETGENILKCNLWYRTWKKQEKRREGNNARYRLPSPWAVLPTEGPSRILGITISLQTPPKSSCASSPWGVLVHSGFITNGDHFESYGWLGLEGLDEMPEISLWFGACILGPSGEHGAGEQQGCRLPCPPCLLGELPSGSHSI